MISSTRRIVSWRRVNTLIVSIVSRRLPKRKVRSCACQSFLFTSYHQRIYPFPGIR
uniref:Uncharacterized protein n=1 Tax=Parascaris equorum TaxID=6256 RepID=A0A914RGV1_PAREQ